MRVIKCQTTLLCEERDKVKLSVQNLAKRTQGYVDLDEWSLAKENALSLIRNLERLNEIENRLADMLE